MSAAPPPQPPPGSPPGPPPTGVRAAPPPPPRRRGRVWPLVVLLLAALAGTAVGVQQREVAATWRERSVAVETQRDEARGRVEALQRQLDEVAASLAVSETDVAALEERVRDLADEKAQAEDVATTTGVERDTLVALSATIAGAVTSLDGCVQELYGLVNDAIDAFNRQGRGEQVDVGPLNQARSVATATCDAARADAADAAARADQLLR